MQYSRGTRVVLAFLVTVIFGAYLYLQIHGYEELRAPMTPVPKATVAPVSEEPAAPAEETPAAQAPEESAGLPVPPTQPPEATPEPVPTVDPESPYGKALTNAAAQGLPEPPQVDIESWELLLANAKHPIETYEPEKLAYLSMNGEDTDISYDYSDYRCPVDARIAEQLVAFTQGCKQAGLPVYLSSGYRSYDTQNYLYNRKIGQGYSPDVAATIVARPGTSEHQTGLACDITDYYHELKDSSLENTATYQWLKEHCTEYGFVVRYPADKSGSADSVTGIIYEPWHFRYVGVEAAKYMTENNLCLEEFLALYGLE